MDVNGLTVGDIATIEELSGQGIGVMEDAEAPKGRLLAAMAFVIRRKQDKGFSFEDAMNLTMAEITEILGLDEDEDPKEAN